MSIPPIPPTGPVADAAPHPDDATWPGWIGGLAIAFGSLTLLGSCCGAMGVLVSPAMGGMAGMDFPPAPGVVVAWMVFDLLLGLVLGGMLILGGIGVLRRRVSGPRMLLKYAMVRVALVVIMIPGALMIMTPSAEWGADLAQAQLDWQAEQGAAVTEADQKRVDDARDPGTVGVAQAVLGPIVGAAFAGILLLVLRRPTVRSAWERWES
jgi:hypothetical protein